MAKKDQNIKKQYATYTELKLLISIKEFQLSQIEGARVRVAMGGGFFRLEKLVKSLYSVDGKGKRY